MRIFLYNPNSSGGNFDYAQKACHAYKLRPGIMGVTLILPRNADVPDDCECKRILLNDRPLFSNRLFSRTYFVFRSFVNPLIFFIFLRRKKNGYVIFNDFDQVSSFVWVPLFRMLKSKFVFSIFLHDPDRDAYLRRRSWSGFTMKKVMSLMSVAFYHEVLPNRPYYKRHGQVKYVPVPHGIYDSESAQGNTQDLTVLLARFKGSGKLIGALGNIRREKNYKQVLEALLSVPEIKLIIAGAPANTSVDVGEFHRFVERHSLSDRVMIISKYLDRSELSEIANSCDAFILYYSKTFQSQSGLLNLLAPFRKPLLVSSNGSPLSVLVQKYELGLMADPDSISALTTMLARFCAGETPRSDWDGYFAYASWNRHAHIAVGELQKAR